MRENVFLNPDTDWGFRIYTPKITFEAAACWLRPHLSSHLKYVQRHGWWRIYLRCMCASGFGTKPQLKAAGKGREKGEM